jgi:cell division inhibitor SulA
MEAGGSNRETEAFSKKAKEEGMQSSTVEPVIFEEERPSGGTSRVLWRPATSGDMRPWWTSFLSEPQATVRAWLTGRGLAVKL